MRPGQASHLNVSVITVVLNQAADLVRTLDSVAAQDYPWCEHIVIDGGSTDGSVAMLEDHADQLAFWSSGPDSGIGEAMNKGIAKATGDLLLFLHADDCFADAQALSRAMAHVGDADHIWAFDILFGADGRMARHTPRPFSAWTYFKNPLPHQGVLCPRVLLQRLGGFDPALKIVMDYDLWLRAYRAGFSLQRVPEVLAIMNDAGVSSRRDWPGLSDRLKEERQVQRRYTETQWWSGLYTLYWPLYLGYRRSLLLFCRSR